MTDDEILPLTALNTNTRRPCKDAYNEGVADVAAAIEENSRWVGGYQMVGVNGFKALGTDIRGLKR